VERAKAHKLFYLLIKHQCRDADGYQDKKNSKQNELKKESHGSRRIENYFLVFKSTHADRTIYHKMMTKIPLMPPTNKTGTQLRRKI